jgi:hypothetical protein
MDPRHAILIAVKEEGQKGLIGRTLLQKKVFFACCLTGQNFAFRPHYYGPYSQSVADATDSLVSNHFLEEQVHRFSESNMFGEMRRHEYKLTEDGIEVAGAVSDDPEVKAWREALQRINSHPFASDFNLLSIAAKVTIVSHGHPWVLSESEIADRAQHFGWNLTSEQIRKVAEFLTLLGF